MIRLTKRDLPFFEIKENTSDSCCWLGTKTESGGRTADLSMMFSRHGVAKHRDVSPCAETDCLECPLSHFNSRSKAEVEAQVEKMIGITRDELTLLI